MYGLTSREHLHALGVDFVNFNLFEASLLGVARKPHCGIEHLSR